MPSGLQIVNTSTLFKHICKHLLQTKMVNMVQALFPFLLNGQSRSSLFCPFGPNAWLVDWVECLHPHTHQTSCKRLSALTLFHFCVEDWCVYIYIYTRSTSRNPYHRSKTNIKQEFKGLLLINSTVSYCCFGRMFFLLFLSYSGSDCYFCIMQMY